MLHLKRGGGKNNEKQSLEKLRFYIYVYCSVNATYKLENKELLDIL